MAIKSIINNTEKNIEEIRISNEDSVDYIDSKLGNDYKRVFTAVHKMEGTEEIQFKSLKDEADLLDYKIYGNTETKTRSYSGSAPLSFPIMDGAVSNYRIYGNTENGESVGERTKNLLDINNLRSGAYAFVDGVYTPNSPGYLCTQKIPCEGNTTYVFSFDGDIRLAGFLWYDENDTYISSNNKSWNGTEINRVFSAVSPINAAYLTMDYASRNSQDPPPMTNAQIEQNTDKSSYEPYGYKISITNNNENANIYLDEPLRKVGTYTDYTDYENQKVIRIIVARKVFDGTENEMTRGYNQIVLQLNTRELLPALGTVNCISNHIIATSANNSWVRRTEPNFKSVAAFSQNNIDQLRFTWNNSNGQMEFEAFKAQLAEWYANGNPLIVDCIIKTPVEEQVTLPALPAQSSTNSLSIGTTVQPSSVAVDVDELVNVGDKTANLFDMSDFNPNNVTVNDDGSFFIGWNSTTWAFSCKVETGKTYFISWEELNETQHNSWLSIAVKAGYHIGFSYPCYITTLKNSPPNVWCKRSSGFTATDDYLSIDGMGAYIRNIMLVEGSTAMNYEPYGFKIPVTITADSAETTDIYLDAPLAKSGDIADYIDYATQKRHNSDGTESNVTLPIISTLAGTNTLSIETEVKPVKTTIKGNIKGKIYGFHINPDVSSSSDAVTYLKNAIGKTPAAMGNSTFSYGDWENAFFMPKPCMLKSNGKVDYYLNPNDYTKKLDGTTSDVANAFYDGNAMMEWPKIWYKFVPGVKDGEVSFYVADYKADSSYRCWSNLDCNGNEIDHFYTAIYNGTGTTKLRSISGVALTSANGNGDTTVTQEVERATANNTTNNVEWYTEVYSDRMLINMLLVLMGKSLNSQAIYGRGLDTGGQEAKEAYVTGTLNDKGLFWGDTSAGTSGVKIFGMENYWGCVQHRTAGLISIDNHAYAKLTYSTADDSSTTGYNQTGTGYLDFGFIPNTNGWIKIIKYNRKGLIPFIIDETNNNSNYYYGDCYYQDTGTKYLLLGGSVGTDLFEGPFYFGLHNAPTIATWGISTTLSCKPISPFN